MLSKIDYLNEKKFAWIDFVAMYDRNKTEYRPIDNQ